MPDPQLTACFRLFGDDLDPRHVTAELGLGPSYQHYKGTLRGPRTQKPWPEGLWSLDSGLPESATLEAHLGALLDKLEAKRSFINRYLQHGWKADLFVGYFSDSGQGGLALSASMLKRLGAFGVALDVDLYMGESSAGT